MKDLDGIDTKLFAQPGKGFEQDEGMPRWDIAGLLAPMAIALGAGPTFRAGAQLAHAFFGTLACARQMYAMGKFDGIIYTIIGLPDGGTFNDPDKLINDLHAVDGQVGSDPHDRRIYDNGADRRSAQILFDEPE